MCSPEFRKNKLNQPRIFLGQCRAKMPKYIYTFYIYFLFLLGQVLLIFMQKMELMLKLTDKENVTSYVLPLVFKGLESQNEEIQVRIPVFYITCLCNI